MDKKHNSIELPSLINSSDNSCNVCHISIKEGQNVCDQCLAWNDTLSCLDATLNAKSNLMACIEQCGTNTYAGENGRE